MLECVGVSGPSGEFQSKVLSGPVVGAVTAMTRETGNVLAH